MPMRWENIPLSREKRGAPGGLYQFEQMTSAIACFESALSALGQGLSDIAWPVRSGKHVLPIAPDKLTAFYWVSKQKRYSLNRFPCERGEF